MPLRGEIQPANPELLPAVSGFKRKTDVTRQTRFASWSLLQRRRI